MNSIDLLGYIAGLTTTLTFLPQVIKTARERSAKDISLLMFVIAGVNEIMWIVWAALIEPINWTIIATNGVLLVMVVIMIFFKFRYNAKPAQAGPTKDLL